MLGLVDVSGSMASGIWARFSEVVVSGGAPAPVAVPPSHKEVAKKMILTHTWHVRSQPGCGERGRWAVHCREASC